MSLPQDENTEVTEVDVSEILERIEKLEKIYEKEKADSEKNKEDLTHIKTVISRILYAIARLERDAGVEYIKRGTYFGVKFD